eukprot:2897866-Rhodomonas_salina.2
MFCKRGRGDYQIAHCGWVLEHGHDVLLARHHRECGDIAGSTIRCVRAVHGTGKQGAIPGFARQPYHALRHSRYEGFAAVAHALTVLAVCVSCKVNNAQNLSDADKPCDNRADGLQLVYL